MGCSSSKNTASQSTAKAGPAGVGNESVAAPASNRTLASETHFSLDEVAALRELFDTLSNSLHHDGLIHQDEFALALFKTQGRSNIFINKVFQVFDIKKNDVIDFEEFVRSLSVFHPRAPLQEKAQLAFRIYDLDNTGWIEPGEIKRFLSALLSDNPAIKLSEEDIDQLVDQTLEEADLAGDGHISLEEWQALVERSPDIIAYMTLPVLKQVTAKYPSFLFKPQTL
ncbi:hypothetical protein WJX73_008177 [Symbiochloris irregularis]|uniref:EF-hand domain-containing protein n=1 Tax=Symbiochloris irregularis TaxID=706552 RepID=A0AAW1PZR0_9CHLO